MRSSIYPDPTFGLKKKCQRGNSLPRRLLSAVGLKKLLAARVAPRKSSKKHPRRIRHSLGGWGDMSQGNIPHPLP
jgi:hypothetical protein